ncbi:MAG TPA: hypothetical protein VL371_15415 [Gemmataceae bacterium]|nr:hypothetical protein [Gemmataceae bacterium]
MTGVVAAWSGAFSVALGLFTAGCGAALGAMHGNLGLVTTFGERGFIAGLLAGAIVGVSVAIDRVETESFLAKKAVPLPRDRDWPTTAAIKPRFPQWRMTHAKSLREG